MPEPAIDPADFKSPVLLIRVAFGLTVRLDLVDVVLLAGIWLESCLFGGQAIRDLTKRPYQYLSIALWA